MHRFSFKPNCLVKFSGYGINIKVLIKDNKNVTLLANMKNIKKKYKIYKKLYIKATRD